ncbi:MAG: Crp/Fnr family transcriptional regulator [Chloroflexi bacterium]|nr:Crp/Fnr family transcriptional regulator [Chloroflexota bacterium]
MQQDWWALLERIKSEVSIQRVREKDVIFHQGDWADALYWVISGAVHLERVDVDGHQAILCRHGPGSFFCPLAFFDRGPQPGTARAETHSVVAVVPRETFMRLMDEHPEFMEQVQAQCFRHIRHIIKRLEVSLFHDVRERLIMVLLEHGEPEPDGTLWVRATQQQLAQWVGASRETISRELANLKREGWVQVRRGAVIVLDPEELRAQLPILTTTPAASRV